MLNCGLRWEISDSPPQSVCVYLCSAIHTLTDSNVGNKYNIHITLHWDDDIKGIPKEQCVFMWCKYVHKYATIWSLTLRRLQVSDLNIDPKTLKIHPNTLIYTYNCWLTLDLAQVCFYSKCPTLQYGYNMAIWLQKFKGKIGERQEREVKGLVSWPGFVDDQSPTHTHTLKFW